MAVMAFTVADVMCTDCCKVQMDVGTSISRMLSSQRYLMQSNAHCLSEASHGMWTRSAWL